MIPPSTSIACPSTDTSVYGEIIHLQKIFMKSICLSAYQMIGSYRIRYDIDMAYMMVFKTIAPAHDCRRLCWFTESEKGGGHAHHLRSKCEVRSCDTCQAEKTISHRQLVYLNIPGFALQATSEQGIATMFGDVFFVERRGWRVCMA